MAIPEGATTPDPQILDLLQTLSETQISTYSALSVLVGGDKTDGVVDFLEGIQETLDEIADSLLGNLPSSSFLAGSGGGAEAALSGGGKNFPSRPIKVQPKDRPTISDMMSLPVEFSMGYLLIYNKLDDMQKGREAGETKKSGSIGGFFSGLLKGAQGLALIAIGLIAFAGAMILFQFIQWGPAMAGLLAFSLFTIGMVIIAKTLGDNMKDFRTFAEGILLMTAGIVLFNFAIWISSKTLPYWPSAQTSLVAYGIFVGVMVIYAKSLGDSIGSFLKFSAAVVVLIAGLVLFNFAIVLSALALPFVVPALASLAAFVVFTGIMIGFATLVSMFAPLFLTFAAAVVLLMVGLLLFAAVIYFFSAMSDKITPAANAVAESFSVLQAIGDLALSAIAMLVIFVAFSAAIIVLSAGLLIWGAALLVMAGVSALVPRAIAGTVGSFEVLQAIKALASELSWSMALLVAFGAAIAVLSLGLLAWSIALGALGALSESQIGRAKQGLTESIEVLSQMKGVHKEILNLAGFGLALGVFSDGLAAFTVVLQKLGDMSGEAMSRAQDGIRSIVAFLTDTTTPGSFGFLVDTMKVRVAAQLVIFGKVVKPLGEALDSLASAFISLGNAGSTTIQSASSALTSIIEVLPKLILIMGDVGLLNNVGAKFKNTIIDIGTGLEHMSKSQIDANKISGIADALTKLNSISMSNDAFDPLLKLLDRQKEIDKLANALDRVAKSLEPPKEGGWITKLGNTLGLSGGTVAGTEGGTTGSGGAPRESVTDRTLASIEAYLKKWDPLVATIATNTGNTVTEVNNMETSITNVLSGTRGTGSILPSSAYRS